MLLITALSEHEMCFESVINREISRSKYCSAHPEVPNLLRDYFINFTSNFQNLIYGDRSFDTGA